MAAVAVTGTLMDAIREAMLACCCGGSGSGSGSHFVNPECCPNDPIDTATCELSWLVQNCTYWGGCVSGTDATTTGDDMCSQLGGDEVELLYPCDAPVFEGPYGKANCTWGATDVRVDRGTIRAGFTCVRCTGGADNYPRFIFCARINFIEGYDFGNGAFFAQGGEANPQWIARFHADVSHFDIASCRPFVLSVSNLAAYTIQEIPGQKWNGFTFDPLPVTKTCPGITLSATATADNL